MADAMRIKQGTIQQSVDMMELIVWTSVISTPIVTFVIDLGLVIIFVMNQYNTEECGFDGELIVIF